MVDDREQMPGAPAGAEIPGQSLDEKLEWLNFRGYDFSILTGQRHGRARVQACIRASGRQCSQIGFGNGQTVAEALAAAWTDSQREPKPRSRAQASAQARPQLSLEDLGL